MASYEVWRKKSLLLCLVLFLYASLFALKFSEAQTEKVDLRLSRRTLAIEEEQPEKKTSSGSKNQTKLIKTTTNSTKSSTLSKPIKTTNSTKSSTLSNPIKATNSTKSSTLSNPNKATNSTKSSTLSKPIKTSNSTKTNLKNLTSSSNSSNSTKLKSAQIKTSVDLSKSTSPKNKTKTAEKSNQLSLEKKSTSPKPKTQEKSTKPNSQNTKKAPPKAKFTQFGFDTDDEDLISEFRDLPSKFHQAFIPDLEKISTTSKAYLTRANQEITQGFKPLVGHKYAPIIASLISCIFLLLPLLLLSIIYNQIKTYISLQKILIFIQAYLCIYFAILSLSYFATGFEPLKFFYFTSKSSYVSMQIFQMLGYVMYLLMQFLGLIVVFSKDSGTGLKFLSLTQMLVSLAVGLHYYLAVFHRAVLNQPPKTNWKIHGIYATCFLLVCLSTGAHRRKKAYLQDDCEDDCKKS